LSVDFSPPLIDLSPLPWIVRQALFLMNHSSSFFPSQRPHPPQETNRCLIFPLWNFLFFDRAVLGFLENVAFLHGKNALKHGLAHLTIFSDPSSLIPKDLPFIFLRFFLFRCGGFDSPPYKIAVVVMEWCRPPFFPLS